MAKTQSLETESRVQGGRTVASGLRH